ncbi:hypothetical protein CVT26_012392 [Gymnopilus dilepis]|uniref:Uncharacterized protein n=1 Tax=Gymnopilus dilepis TaxID=231916 RepID=A0A409X8Z8_9AGAR|nr:hypothetical protein CVT26_012392 [Gymnopilus dilepis]
MFPRVTSLQGLAILRPFDRRKIQGRLSEDRRRETKRLEYLRLHTILKHGEVEESAAAQNILSHSRYCEQISMVEEGVETPTVDSVHRLQNLQNFNMSTVQQMSNTVSLPSVSLTKIMQQPQLQDQEQVTSPLSDLRFPK